MEPKFLRAVRGTRDIFGIEAIKMRFVETVCFEIFKNYGFKEIIFPTFEEIGLYLRSVGETTDIVEKQMYEFLDKKGRRLVLRPEGTASVVRVFNEHNLNDRFVIKRFCYFGPMFRYERPQRGRYREFYQFGAEIFAELPPAADFVLIKCVKEVLNKLNIETQLYINSVGCISCREKYKNDLVQKLKEKDLCNDCKSRIDRNPLRILDCKIDYEKIKDVSSIIDTLCDKCRKDYEGIKTLLKEEKINFFEDKLLVRGLDYYTGFVFEFKTKNLSFAESTICAGGRYDNLTKELGGQEVVACGCAFGIDRIVEILDEKLLPKERTKLGIAIVSDEYLVRSIEVIDKIKNLEKYIILGLFSGKSLKSQMRNFNNEGCDYVIIIGEEIKNGYVVIKNLKDNYQTNIKLETIVEELNK
jgi:histidyl-tRNA synthetase